MIAEQPIGIFDSGIGGLTVAAAIKHLMPEEQIIYFGDTAHLPYGDKSSAAIQAYSVKIADVLLRKKCKIILIACNSASAAAFDLVKEYVGSKAHVFNVIDPVVDYVREHYPEKEIGLIGTKTTVASNVYANKIEGLNRSIRLQSLATPMLVPMIEEGFYKNQISTGIISEYLNHDKLQSINALILGCTHYPVIKDKITEFYANAAVDIIDSSVIVANSLKGYLAYHNLLVTKRVKVSSDIFLVSDFTASFEKTTKTFFGEQIELERYPLWE
ncbi:MAG: glutamate racemase [Cyclobacteriaceae bacterium]|nr:glutamate racemase [Cyclobacteriaceae bacterium]MCH8517410.1 glutamate racemase [Cyclobacteriaceae bacterium]